MKGGSGAVTNLPTEITVTFNGNYNLLNDDQKNTINMLFRRITARIISQNRYSDMYWKLTSSIINKTFSVDGYRNQDDRIFNGAIEKLKNDGLNPVVSKAEWTWKEDLDKIGFI